MGLFNTKKPKEDLGFEFSFFQPFYEEINKRQKMDDKKKIINAINKSAYFFENWSENKKSLLDQLQSLTVFKVKEESRNFLQEISNPGKDILEKIIKDDASAKWLVCYGERLGGFCAVSGVSSSQIRNVYGQIKSLEMNIANKPLNSEIDALSLRKMQVLIPRLAYAAKREGGALKQLSKVFSTSIKMTETVGDFMRLSQFFEATLAYHKAYGGK